MDEGLLLRLWSHSFLFTSYPSDDGGYIFGDRMTEFVDDKSVFGDSTNVDDDGVPTNRLKIETLCYAHIAL